MNKKLENSLDNSSTMEIDRFNVKAYTVDNSYSDRIVTEDGSEIRQEGVQSRVNHGLQRIPTRFQYADQENDPHVINQGHLGAYLWSNGQKDSRIYVYDRE